MERKHTLERGQVPRRMKSRKFPSHVHVSAMQLSSRRHCCTVFGSQQERPGDEIRDRLLVNTGDDPSFLPGFNVMLMLSDVVTENRCHLESR